MLKRLGWLVFTLLVAGLALGTRVVRAEEPSGGELTGLLTAKAETWIEVKVDDVKEAVRYTASWIGGNPADGGGFDQETLKAIASLPVPNRVKLSWKFEERPRVLAVSLIKPEKPEGEVVGTVNAKGEAWLELKTDSGLQRYVPRWIGGNPSDGGGFDKDMLRQIKATEVGARTKVHWKYEERLRVLAINPA